MMEIDPDFSQIAAVIFGLIVFGVLYNELVAWMERRGYLEGYLSLVVAVGVLVTIIGVGVISLEAALLTFVPFAAAGTPMIIGSISRYVQAREAAKKDLRDEVKHE